MCPLTRGLYSEAEVVFRRVDRERCEDGPERAGAREELRGRLLVHGLDAKRVAPFALRGRPWRRDAPHALARHRSRRSVEEHRARAHVDRVGPLRWWERRVLRTGLRRGLVEGLVGGARGGDELAGVLEHAPLDVGVVLDEPLVVVDHAVPLVLRDEPIVDAPLAERERRVDPAQRAHHLTGRRQHPDELLGAVRGHVAQREVDVSHTRRLVARRHPGAQPQNGHI